MTPTFLLINREKISGKRNCSSRIAVCSLLGFWLVLVCWFFFCCSLSVPSRKKYLSLWGQIPRLDLSKIYQCGFLPKEGSWGLAQQQKMVQFSPLVHSSLSPWCSLVPGDAQLSWEAPACSRRLGSCKGLQGKDVALEGDLRVPQMSDIVWGTRSGPGRDG